MSSEEHPQTDEPVSEEKLPASRADVSFLPRTPPASDLIEDDDGAPEQVPTSPIGRCPFCAYDLRFCKEPFRCPECGFDYDEMSRAWWDTEAHSGYAQYWLMILIVLGIAGAMMVRVVLQTARLLHVGLLGMAVGGAAWVVFEAFRLRRTHRLGRCIVACPQGLFVRSDRYEDWVPWPAFGDLVFSKMGFYVRRLDSDQTIEIPMSFEAFEDEDDWVALREELHQFRAYYLSYSGKK